MSTALQAAEQHLAELAANGIAARDKPSAFHHGLITQLVAELKAANDRIAIERRAHHAAEREFAREARDIAAEAVWADRELRDERGW